MQKQEELHGVTAHLEPSSAGCSSPSAKCKVGNAHTTWAAFPNNGNFVTVKISDSDVESGRLGRWCD